jgi:hypothetical protein
MRLHMTVYARAKAVMDSDEPQSRLDITAAHVLALLERFPLLYREAWVKPSNKVSRFAWSGFDVGDGWLGIVERLSAKLAADPTIHISQLKASRGRLTVYFSPREDSTISTLGEDELHRTVDEAGDESERTCEVCGEPGTNEMRAHAVTVRCEPCYWLDDIVEACIRIVECIGAMDLAAFFASRMYLDATKRHIQHIGEASMNQSPRSRARFPSIDWESLDRVMSEKPSRGFWHEFAKMRSLNLHA